jgi:hypothetical protein
MTMQRDLKPNLVPMGAKRRGPRRPPGSGCPPCDLCPGHPSTQVVCSTAKFRIASEPCIQPRHRLMAATGQVTVPASCLPDATAQHRGPGSPDQVPRPSRGRPVPRVRLRNEPILRPQLVYLQSVQGNDTPRPFARAAGRSGLHAPQPATRNRTTRSSPIGWLRRAGRLGRLRNEGLSHTGRSRADSFSSVP